MSIFAKGGIDKNFIKNFNEQREALAKAEGTSVEEYNKRHPLTLEAVPGQKKGGIFGTISNIANSITDNPLKTAVNVGRAFAGDPSGVISQAVEASKIDGLDKIANVYNAASNLDFNNLSADAIKDKAFDYASNQIQKKASDALNKGSEKVVNKITPSTFEQNFPLQGALDQDVVSTSRNVPFVQQSNNFENIQDTAVDRQQQLRKRFSDLTEKLESR